MNPAGWPQMVLFCTGKNYLGQDVVKAYGSAIIPTEPGMHQKTIRMYSPVENNSIWEYFGFNREIDGLSHLINNPRAIASPDGREVSRVMATGKIIVNMQVTQRNLNRHGYTVKS